MILSNNHHPSQRPTFTLSRSDDLTVRNLRERVQFAHGDIHLPHSHLLHRVHCRKEPTLDMTSVQWIFCFGSVAPSIGTLNAWEDGTLQRSAPLQVNAYYFHIWPDTVSFPTLFLGSRLFQKFVANAWALIEQERLQRSRTNQKTLRAKEYSSLQAGFAEGIDPSEIGKRVILPSSYPSSPRNMVQLYQDAMAIVRAFGAPDLYITMTCNTAWPEIVDVLLPGQNALNRPDMVARVFQSSRLALMTSMGTIADPACSAR